MGVDLTEAERGMLAGHDGPLLQFALAIVLRAAEIWRAPHLTPARFAHIDACHYNGQAHLDFARKLEREGAAFPVPVWTNTLPVSLLQQDGRAERDPDFVAGARELAEIYRRLGCRPVWTCAPYQLPGGPGLGDQIIGSESNAVSYYNSVVGARTQKYGDYLDVCAALTGRVPHAGLHTDAGRRGQIEFDVAPLGESRLQREETCHLIGYLMGRHAGSALPVIKGLPQDTPKDSLKAIAAAGGASGGVAMFHALGVTPEAPDASTAYQGGQPVRRMAITSDLLAEAHAALSPARAGRLDMVALGTPHFSLPEMRRLAEAIDGKRVHGDVTFYVSTARFIRDRAREEGLLEPIERAGVEILTDTCTYFSPAVRACRGRVMTNSAKWAFYAPGMLPIDVAFGSLEDCVTSACRGEVILHTQGAIS